MRRNERHWAFMGVIAASSAALFPLSDYPTEPVPTAAHQMVAAAQAFLDVLDAESREKATRPFEHEERFNWHFVPRAREGLPFDEMNEDQRRAAHALMRSALSSAGYLKATGVMRLEQILGMLENRPERRNPERYFFLVFGTPGQDSPWAWRLEGHHLSLSFTSVTNTVVTTPAFMGSNPATVPSGPSMGWRVLGAEEDLGRALVLMLNAQQRAKATIATEAPRDIFTGADRTASLERFEGLPASEMNDAQRVALMRVIEEYVHNMQHDIAHEQLEKITDAGFEKIYFAWAGGTEPGDGHYYRVHGPTVLFEYDNTQNDANHVHAVWRDFSNDFGDDLLRRHYEQSNHHQ